MIDLNNLSIVGRLTRDPEKLVTKTGAQVARFSLAVNSGFGDNAQTSFFDCVAFGKLAGVIVEYCRKGQRIGLTGSLEQNRWENRDGQKRSRVEIQTREMQFLDPKQKSEPVADTVDGEIVGQKELYDEMPF